jgi:2-polyprenyl-3-methyl-5-hydroxy-6-metoxy-1,4-benzoquinol methylase
MGNSMNRSGKRDFDNDALTWDDNPVAVERSRAVAEAMVREVRPTGDMDAMDFGAGTGLVTLALQPYVKSITAADSSRGMLSVLEGKIAAQGFANVHTMFLDLDTDEPPEARFDLIVTSMVMHHMADVPRVLRAFHKMLRPGGVVAIADLDAEDGTFHPDNTGIHHFGFDRDDMSRMLEAAGFRDTHAVTAFVMHKEGRDYPVFLITAHKD